MSNGSFVFGIVLSKIYFLNTLVQTLTHNAISQHLLLKYRTWYLTVMEPTSQPKFIFPALVTVTLIAPLAVHMLSALPVVKSDLGVSDSMAYATISWVMIVMAFATVLYGGLSDQWGGRPVLLTGLALYTIGAELSGLQPIYIPYLLDELCRRQGRDAASCLPER